MKNSTNKLNITLRIAKETELDKFKTDLQEAFRISAEKEFGHAIDEPIPSDSDFEDSVKYAGAIVYQVILDGNIVGGAIVAIDEVTQHNKLLLFFISTNCHSQGVGYKAWKAIEKNHPKTKVWETTTPYFEKRNIHFYVNKCGFKIVEYFSKYHPDPNFKSNQNFDEEDDEMFKFEKQM
ncbi:GNAT family N-acetyltransferase [Malaciobacter mytili]|uniref:GNAT family N-acetyltransferase n=1 Tax=Malaciobacter mytili TaxID=603050 RepID=UPI00100BD047|nr:GNAT family N-acetyltransferase [Malaciobacter mytili]RXI45025.1 GNAT family N-acetyltransferase [Malaciobacter mytili]